MKDETKNNHDEGSDTNTSLSPSAGNDEHRDSAEVGSKQVDNSILVRKTKDSGTQDTKAELPRRGAKDRLAKVKKPRAEHVIEGSVVEFEMGATINTGQYENIQPKFKLAVSSLEKGEEIGMAFIKDLTSKYSMNGATKERTAGATKKLSSFNEKDIEVDFDAGAHSYSWGIKKLIGATTFIQRFYKKFDAPQIAKVCAKSWEVPQQDIEDMWNSNGNIASNLGTLVDNALEHYNKYFEMGEKIKAKNGKENPAMPKHPLIKNIIEAFHALPHPVGQVVHQAFITDTEQGFCGQADRLLITGEKKCRIQDFKVQIGATEEDKNSKPLAPFDILPATKLTKYQLQMSFYANMLQKSGWEVEGLDAFVYEDTWKIYPLDIIKVI